LQRLIIYHYTTTEFPDYLGVDYTGGRALDVVAHEVPATVADEFLAGPLEPCRREVAGEPHDPEAVDGSGGA